MAKSANQKLKLIYLMDILREWTDEKHYLSMNEIIEALAAYGVNAERKLLVDAVLASRFVTVKQSRQLIDKLCVLTRLVNQYNIE